MKLRVRQIGALCVLALALTQAAFRFQQDDEPKTELGKRMSAINTALKVVDRQIDKPAQNASTLKQFDIIEANIREALKFEPEKKQQIPAAQQAKFVADYKSGIESLLATAVKAKDALKAGKNAEAAALVDEMKDIQKRSHREFRIRKTGGPS